jgi:hypothetical protein
MLVGSVVGIEGDGRARVGALEVEWENDMMCDVYVIR